MKQVKIEGNNIIPGRLHITERTIISIWGHKYTREEFDRMIEQHKPPTWEEVVKVWEDVWVGNNTVKVIYENSEISVEIENFIAYVINLQTGVFQIFKWEMGNYRTSLEVLNAINLTIDYLKGNENA